MYSYRVTEVNVDGCGGSATEFIQFHQALQPAEVELFNRILQKVKKESEDSDTTSMIEDALDEFAEASGIKGVIGGAPYEGAFEF